MAKTTTKKIKLKKLPVVVLLVILFFVGGIYAIKYFQQKSLEHKFSLLENSLLQTKRPTENITGVFFEESKNCRKDQNKFSKGPLYCYIEMKNINYKYDSKVVLDTLKQELEKNSFYKESQQSEKVDKDYVFISLKYSYRGIPCSLTSTYYINGSQENTIKILCSAISAQSFYPYESY